MYAICPLKLTVAGLINIFIDSCHFLYYFPLIKLIHPNSMETLLRSASVDFPRRKIYLTNLNQLIQRKIIMQPEIEVSSKLFPQRDFAKKLSISHQRIKSSVQLRSQRFDLRWTQKKSKDMKNSTNGMTGSQQFKIHDAKKMTKIKSTQLQFEVKHDLDLRAKMNSTHSVFAQNFCISPSLSNEQCEQREPAQKNFLKKGSSLQKQIVINLLRHKMMKEQQDKEKKEYSNNDIIKMIQVFKGVGLTESQGKRSIIANQYKQTSSMRNVRQEHLREIKGWEQDPPHEFQDHEQK